MIDTLLRVGLSNAASAGVLAIVLLPLARLSRRPALTHALSVLILLKLVTPPLLALPLAWPSHAPRETPRQILAAPREASVQIELVRDVSEPRDVSVAVPVPMVTPPVRAADWRTRIFWKWLVVAAWLGGSLSYLILITGRLLALRRVLRLSTPAPQAVENEVRTLARSLRVAAPPVYFVPGTPSPMLLAMFSRPRLVIPQALWATLDDGQRRSLCLHELAHLCRRDHWVRYLEMLVTVLYWWHPAAWWTRRALREAEEQCCDAWVVWAMPSGVNAYLTTLLAAVDFLSQVPRSASPATALLASGMGQFHCLQRRLKMVREKSVQRRLTRAGLAAVLGLGAAILTVGPVAVRGGEVSEETAAANAALDKAAAVEAPKEDRNVDWEVRRLDKPAPSSAGPGEVADATRAADQVEKLKHEVMRLQAELQRAQMQLTKYQSILNSFPRGGTADPAAADPRRDSPSDHLMIGGVIIHVGGNGQLEAFDHATKQRLWAISGSPGMQVNADEGGRLIVRWHGRGIVLDPASGKELKQFFDAKDAPAGGDSGRGAEVDRLKTLEDRMDKLTQAVEGLVKMQNSSPEHAPRPGELQRQ
jgi:beta-lactamase regulating signal transducer with metallopeptidase domain